MSAFPTVNQRLLEVLSFTMDFAGYNLLHTFHASAAELVRARELHRRAEDLLAEPALKSVREVVHEDHVEGVVRREVAHIDRRGQRDRRLRDRNGGRWPSALRSGPFALGLIGVLGGCESLDALLDVLRVGNRQTLGHRHWRSCNG